MVAHQTRNTYIARVLREMGHIRELGEGIRRIYDLMNTNDLVPPEIESGNNAYTISLYYKHIFTKEEKIWLLMFDHLGLTHEQMMVVRLGIDGRPISTKDIYDALDIVSEEYYRKLIESLRVLGVLKTKYNKTQVQAYCRRHKVNRKEVAKYFIEPIANKLSHGESRREAQP